MDKDLVHNKFGIFLILLGIIILLCFGYFLYLIVFHSQDYGFIVYEVNESPARNEEITVLDDAFLEKFPAFQEILKKGENGPGQWNDGERIVGDHRLNKEEWERYRGEFTLKNLEYEGKFYRMEFFQS